MLIAIGLAEMFKYFEPKYVSTRTLYNC